MKKIIVFIVCLIQLFSLTAFAAENENLVSVNNDDNSLIVYSPDVLIDEEKNVFGLTATQFKEYMLINNMVLYGTDIGNSFVFNLSCTNTDFSNQVSDFYDLSDEAVLDFADDFLAKKDGIVTVNGIKYVVSNSTKQNNETEFSVRQYITVRNNNLYVLTFNVPSSDIDDAIAEKIDETVGRISIIREQNIGKKSNNLTIVLLVALIIVIATVAIVLIVSIIKDIKAKKDQADS